MAYDASRNSFWISDSGDASLKLLVPASSGGSPLAPSFRIVAPTATFFYSVNFNTALKLATASYMDPSDSLLVLMAKSGLALPPATANLLPAAVSSFASPPPLGAATDARNGASFTDASTLITYTVLQPAASGVPVRIVRYRQVSGVSVVLPDVITFPTAVRSLRSTACAIDASASLLY
jgi:hypothetical protein